MPSVLTKKLLTCTAIASIASFVPVQAHAADQSAAIEAGGTVNVNGGDTFTIDGVNDGVGASTSVVFTNNAGNAIDSLTIGSSGGGGGATDNVGEIGSITILDNNGTNTLVIQEPTDAINNTLLVITGDVNGNVATDANDLNINLTSLNGGFIGDTLLKFRGNVDLGSGQITLTGNSGTADFSSVLFNQSADASVTGRIISTTDDNGSFVFIQNTGTLTFNSSIGGAGSNGIQRLALGGSFDNAAFLFGAEAFGTAIFNDTVDAAWIDIDADAGGDSVADFNGNVTGSTLNIESGGAGGETVEARFSKDVTVTSITLDEEAASATITFDGTSAQSITGTINGASAGEGDMRFGSNSNVTFNSEIGNGNALGSMRLTGTSTISINEVFLSVESALDTDIGIFVGTNAIVNMQSEHGGARGLVDNVGDIDFNGTLNLSGAGQGRIFSGSDTFIDGTINQYANQFNLKGDDSLIVGGSSDTVINVGGEIRLLSDATFGGGATTTTLNIRKTDGFDPNTEVIIDADDDTITIGGSLVIGIESSSLAFDIGDTVTVIDSNENATTSYATLIGNKTITFRDTAFLNLEDAGSDAQDLKFIISAKSEVDGSTEQTNGVLNNALAATSDDAAARSAIMFLSSANSNDAGLQMLQDSSGGTATTHATAGNMVTGFDMVSSRLSNIRGGSQTGLSSGDQMSERTYWMRAFGTTAEQDLRSGVQGYEAYTAGIMVGGDVMLNNNVRLGIDASYAVTDVQTDGSGNHKTDINTYRLGVYGGKDFDSYYIEGQASIAYNDIETSRTITFGGLDRTASGDTNGYEYGVRVGAGMPLAIDDVQTITPYANFQYIHADVDSFTEKGAGSLNINTSDQDIDIAELAVGARYNANMDYSEGTFRPEIRAAAAYNFIGDTSETTQQFTGGGSTFTTKGSDVAQFSVNYGAGVSWETKDQSWEFSLDYDGKAKSDYITHGARVEAKLRF